MSQRIVARTQALSRFPYLGRSGRIEGARELVLGGTPYIVRYTVVGSEVQIDKLWHASRLVEED